MTDYCIIQYIWFVKGLRWSTEQVELLTVQWLYSMFERLPVTWLPGWMTPCHVITWLNNSLSRAHLFERLPVTCSHGWMTLCHVLTWLNDSLSCAHLVEWLSVMCSPSWMTPCHVLTRLNDSLSCAHLVEWLPVGGGEGDDAGLSAPVVCPGDAVKLLLASRVPQHQSDILTLQAATAQQQHQ